MPLPTPQAAAQKWADNTSRATPAYTAGIQATTVNPMALAAAQKSKYLQRVQDAVSSGKYESRLMATSPQYWKDQALSLGATRIAAGVAKAQSKQQAFYTQFFPFLQSVTDQTNSMPSTTLEDRIAKMVAQARAVAQFKRT